MEKREPDKIPNGQEDKKKADRRKKKKIKLKKLKFMKKD